MKWSLLPIAAIVPVSLVALQLDWIEPEGWLYSNPKNLLRLVWNVGLFAVLFGSFAICLLAWVRLMSCLFDPEEKASEE